MPLGKRWAIKHRETLGLYGTETRWTVRAAIAEVTERNRRLVERGLEPCWEVSPR